MSSSAPLATADGLAAELTAELKDHSYGLRSFTTPAPCHEDDRGSGSGSGPKASAAVELLEGIHMTVVLDASGYTAAGAEDTMATSTFETLTGLLAAVSSEFSSAMHKCVSDKLIQAMAADSRLVPEEDFESDEANHSS
ncbi:hypothetical protein EV175_004510 [Coemansia sp. RSA 1933]|nr:hypothetical protein EV175_004510 [Coemansia sp. RSA 1933]